MVHLDPAIERYRIKIIGLPMGTTAAELSEKFKRSIKGKYVVPSNQTSTTASLGTIAYLQRQTSEKFARQSIKYWRKQDYFPGFVIKYQLEIDHNDIDQGMDDSSVINNPEQDDGDNDNHIESNQETPINSQLFETENSELYTSTLIKDEQNSLDEEKIGEYP